jgi:hypothetical protein
LAIQNVRQFNELNARTHDLEESLEYQTAARVRPRPRVDRTPDRGSTSGRVALEGRAVQIADVAADPEYTWAEAITMGRTRTYRRVPPLRGFALAAAVVNSVVPLLPRLKTPRCPIPVPSAVLTVAHRTARALNGEPGYQLVVDRARAHILV